MSLNIEFAEWTMICRTPSNFFYFFCINYRDFHMSPNQMCSFQYWNEKSRFIAKNVNKCSAIVLFRICGMLDIMFEFCGTDNRIFVLRDKWVGFSNEHDSWYLVSIFLIRNFDFSGNFFNCRTVDLDFAEEVTTVLFFEINEWDYKKSSNPFF